MSFTTNPHNRTLDDKRPIPDTMHIEPASWPAPAPSPQIAYPSSVPPKLPYPQPPANPVPTGRPAANVVVDAAIHPPHKTGPTETPRRSESPLPSPSLKGVVSTAPVISPASQQPSPSPAHKVVLVGNPGVGKSSILNTLFGKARFPAGVKLGSGLTTKMTAQNKDSVQYVDTPGLDDVETRKSAGDEIANALSGPGIIRLLFITTLEAGRVRPGDLTTLDLVLSAIRKTGVAVSNRFSILINKCEPSVIKSLGDKMEFGKMVAQFAFVEECKHVGTLPLDGAAIGEDNALLANFEQILSFVKEAPSFTLEKEHVVQIDVKSYDERKEALAKEAMAIRRAMEEVKKQYENIQTGQAGGNVGGHTENHGGQSGGHDGNPAAEPFGGHGGGPLGGSGESHSGANAEIRSMLGEIGLQFVAFGKKIQRLVQSDDIPIRFL